MPTPISEALGVSHQTLVDVGAFDGFTDVDSLLYVDPHLLARCPILELADSSIRFENYFKDVLTLLRHSKRQSDSFWQTARRKLVFRELPAVPLGYSKGHTSGSAIGHGLAAELTELAKEIVDAGITDPRIFELVGLLQEGIGADRVSDMTIRIILPDLLSYSQRTSYELDVETKSAQFQGQEYNLPATKSMRRPVILIPASILRHLPVARSWEDIDLVASHNAALRHRVNHIIGDTWKRATSNRVTKADLRRTLLRHPDLLKDLLVQYEAKTATPYDFDADPAAQQLWYHISKEIASEEPLALRHFMPVSSGNLLSVVHSICKRFKALIEDNRLSRLLYNDDGTPRRERAAQLTFYAIADACCKANDLDVSPETDAGVGPVDFKISRGYTRKVTVEVKLSSNTRLVHGFRAQLPAYARAENDADAIYLIVRTTKSESRIKQVLALAGKAKEEKRVVPEIVVIDGRLVPSASRR